MGTFKKHLKWVIPVVAIVIAGGVFGYLKFFTWNPERQKLANINGRIITVAQFGRELTTVPSPYQEMLKEEPKQFLDQLITREILLQEAKRLGVKSDPSAKGEEIEVSLMQNLLKQEVMDKITVSKEEVDELYRAHKDQLGKKKYEEVAQVIENLIRDAKGKEKMEEYLASLRGKAKIDINENRLAEIKAQPPASNTSEEFKKALGSGKPVLVDFGSNSCIPCRQLRPILKEIGQELTGKAHILVVDVYKYQDMAKEYKVSLIPTLVFFNNSGKEVFRHVGAWDKASILGKLKEIGAA